MMRPLQDERAEQGFTPEQVAALTSYGRELRLQTGALLFDETATVDSFYLVLEGEVGISRLDGADEISLGTHRTGEFTGGLAVLTGKTSIHRARAAWPSRILEIDSETFRRVAVELPDVADVFISGLARRIRYTQRAFRQQEKLAALGKLSAGLAHELNNPAAAARRASEELSTAVLKPSSPPSNTTSVFRQPRAGPWSPCYARRPRARLPSTHSSSATRKKSLPNGWTSVIQEPWDLAATLAAAESRPALQATRGRGRSRVARSGRGLALEDHRARRAGRRGCDELGPHLRARRRDEGLHLHGRAADDEVDVTAGLDNTMTILGHRLKGVSVQREYEQDLPGYRVTAAS